MGYPVQTYSKKPFLNIIERKYRDTQDRSIFIEDYAKNHSRKGIMAQLPDGATRDGYFAKIRLNLFKERQDVINDAVLALHSIATEAAEEFSDLEFVALKYCKGFGLCVFFEITAPDPRSSLDCSML